MSLITAIPSGGISLLSVAAGLVGLNALTALISSVGLVGVAGGSAFIVGRETPLVRSVRTVQGGLSDKEREDAKEELTALDAPKPDSVQTRSSVTQTAATFFAKHSVENKEPSVNPAHNGGETKKR